MDVIGPWDGLSPVLTADYYMSQFFFYLEDISV